MARLEVKQRVESSQQSSVDSAGGCSNLKRSEGLLCSTEDRGNGRPRVTLNPLKCVCRICTCTLRDPAPTLQNASTLAAISGQAPPTLGTLFAPEVVEQVVVWAWEGFSSRRGGTILMPELQNPEEGTDQVSSILAGYMTPKNLAQALGVSERTVARWHRLREGPPRVEFGRKVFYRLESVNTWIASCERPEARADRVRRRPRLRAVEPSRVAVPMQRNHLGALSGPSGSHD
jgi:hypothetical protein